MTLKFSKFHVCAGETLRDVTDEGSSVTLLHVRVWRGELACELASSSVLLLVIGLLALALV